MRDVSGVKSSIVKNKGNRDSAISAKDATVGHGGQGEDVGRLEDDRLLVVQLSRRVRD